MSFLHAGYAAGAVAGALGAGALLSAGTDYRAVYLTILIPLSAVLAAFFVTRFPDGYPDGERAPICEDGGAAKRSMPGRWSLYRSVPLLLVAGVSGLGFASEGVMERWSGIYLRDFLGLGAMLGGSGVAVFFGAMAAGRLGTGWLVMRAGNRRTLQAAGLLAAAGMTVALPTTRPALVVAGFLLVGLAISGMAPLAQSMAGNPFPGRAGAAASVVITFGSGGGLLATVVGGAAELAGLRAALGLVVGAGLAVFALSLRREKGGRTG